MVFNAAQKLKTVNLRGGAFPEERLQFFGDNGATFMTGPVVLAQWDRWLADGEALNLDGTPATVHPDNKNGVDRLRNLTATDYDGAPTNFLIDKALAYLATYPALEQGNIRVTPNGEIVADTLGKTHKGVVMPGSVFKVVLEMAKASKMEIVQVGTGHIASGQQTIDVNIVSGNGLKIIVVR